MKNFKDLKKINEGKYTTFQGESKEDKVNIVIIG